MGDFEDVLKALKDGELEPDEAVERLEKFSGSSLRKKAEERDAFEQKFLEQVAKVKRLEMAPKITEVLAKAGVNFEALRPTEREAIDHLEFEGDAPSEDWVAKIVSEKGFPMIERSPEEEEEEEEPAAAKVARQARGAPSGGGTLTSGINMEVYTSWPQEKRLRFRNEHPAEHRMLREGKTVTGIAFS